MARYASASADANQGRTLAKATRDTLTAIEKAIA